MVCDWSCQTVCTQTAKCVVLLPHYLSVIKPCDVLSKWITERGNWPINRETKRDNVVSEIPAECKASYRSNK